MSNKTKDILDEILDIEEPTAELVEKKPDTLIVKSTSLNCSETRVSDFPV